MGRKKNHRRAELKYEFDRLGKKKMEQVFDILLSQLLREFETDGEVLAPRERT